MSWGLPSAQFLYGAYAKIFVPRKERISKPSMLRCKNSN